MPDPSIPDSQPTAETSESFGELLSQFEQSHSHKAENGSRQIDGTVVTVSAESVFLDIGFKSEGILPLAAFQSSGEEVKPGDKLAVSVKGRDADGFYELSRFQTALPKDWSTLEQAFANKATIMGTVTGVIKGGLSVDVGVRAFLPGSRSGTRDAAEMEKLVGQEIRCRIIKLDVADEDVVVDRRVVTGEEERSGRERRYAEVKEGDIVQGTVRTLTDYGAFVDIGGVDGLLHVGDIAWGRVSKPADVLSVGQQIEARVLKIDPEKPRISLGLKQIQPDPWGSVAEKYKTGERAQGVVTRVVDFGAFVELEPGVEGLIHLSEMSWSKKARQASDVVKPGETVEAVVLAVNPGGRRISLGLKQALGDPWAEVTQKFRVGTVIEGPITSLSNFGAFVQLCEGVEGMIHVSEISAEKRIKHPQEVLKLGQLVKAQVIAIDKERRLLRLGMKQLVPTSLDEYIAEHKEGDVVTGRLIEISNGQASVELGEGIQGACPVVSENRANEDKPAETSADLSALSSMLKARWKGGAASGATKTEAVRAGQIRSFRISKLDAVTKKIDLQLAP